MTLYLNIYTICSIYFSSFTEVYLHIIHVTYMKYTTIIIKIMNIFITPSFLLPYFMLSLFPHLPFIVSTNLRQLPATIDQISFFRILYTLHHTEPTLLSWLISLNVNILRFIHIIVCFNSSFSLLLSSIPLDGYTLDGLSILLLMYIAAAKSLQLCPTLRPHQVHFIFFSIKDKTVMVIGVLVFVWAYAFISLR